MQLKDIKFYEGKNIYCYQPVIKGVIDLSKWAGRYSDEIEGFSEKLTVLLPGLGEHHCSRGYPGGFLQRLEEGTYVGHIIEHVALELLNQADFPANYGRTISTDDPGVYEVIIESPLREASVASLLAAVKLVDALLEGQPVALEFLLSEIKEAGRESQLGPSTKVIIEAAKKRGIPVTRLNQHALIQLGYGKYLKRIQASLTDLSSAISVDIACDKALTKAILAEAGIPVPPGRVARKLAEAEQIASELGFPLVAKPIDGHHGNGVTVGIKDSKELAKAYHYAQAKDTRVILEKYIAGRHFRALVINNKIIAVAERFPPYITGDGEQDILQLIQRVNQHPWRGEGHEKPLTRIKIDKLVLACLERQGYSLETIPSVGKEIFLRENANLSTGGTAVDVTDQVCPENKEMIERAVRLVGLDIAGVDIVAADIKLPLKEGKGAIIEINAAPGLRMHCFPMQGQSRPVGEAIIDWLFPPGQPFQIPIVSITGTNGKTTTARMVEHILKASGKVVGLTTSDGIYIGNRLIVSGDNTGPRSAQVVLRDPLVDIAVLETARGGIIRAGLGYAESTVGVITNITADHLGQDGIESLEDLAQVKALVGEVVPPNGYIVINADDQLSVDLVERFRGKIIFFTRIWNNPVVRRHLGTGGWAIFEKSGEIILAKGEKAIPIIKTRAIPATFGGMAGHNVENALAAVGTAVALEIEPKAIAKTLSSFGCNLHQNPGRMNIIPIGDMRVVLDYGHNSQGFKRILETLSKLHPGRLVVVVGMPGDRRDTDIQAAGAVLAHGAHQLIIKEDQDLRGRFPGEVTELMKAGALAAGFKEELISVIRDEAQAVAQALREARAGDMVVVFYEKLNRVVPVLEAALKRCEPLVGRYGQSLEWEPLVPAVQ